MTRQKKIFVAAAILFFALLAFVAYDIGSRTTFPGSRKSQVEKDSISSDSTNTK